MVAVLTVFANHLWGWPRGGFVGVDVFFVISGFLITGNLLRMAETRGTVSFTTFYWNRVRRIVPAATVVLFLTYLAATLVFLPFRSHSVGVDALFAFVFASNWWFMYENTDYFSAAANTVSPVQHYWSLSIEEQFYFVWPALIFIISVLIVRRKWPHSRRMAIAGGVMAVIVAASLWWAVHETATSPTRAYFDTFARVWELGVGALLATAIGLLARIPTVAKPVLSWVGIGIIAASLLLIGGSAAGFPAPSVVLPVVGAALVIAAGVGEEPTYQEFLRNPISTYIGDISYSLYLVHWPIIVVLGALMDPGLYFSITVVGLAFGLAVVSYHFVENPLRKADITKLRDTVHAIRRRRYQPRTSSRYAMVGAATLLTVAGVAFTFRPVSIDEIAPPSMAAVDAHDADPSAPRSEVNFGPMTSALQDEILAALRATEWPPLDPSMESLLASWDIISPEVANCDFREDAEPNLCGYGSQSAPVRIVIVGDSVGMGYAEILREVALNSNHHLQVINETMLACAFTQDEIVRASETSECPGNNDRAVDVINTIKPDVVIISNGYLKDDRVKGSLRELSASEWADELRRIVDRFRGSTKKVVLLAPPPSDVSIKDCVSKRSSKPASCIGRIPAVWTSKAEAEQGLAESIGGAWIDSRPWFCSPGGLCPSFVGSTPARVDYVHMAPPYASKILPAVAESLRDAGVPLPPVG
jgi:peptidoglycan/LPS O-acetylase OafA/YrhL